VALLATTVAAAGAVASASARSAHKKPAAATIVIKTFSFSPATLKVKPGEKVTVENKTPVTHTLTSTQHKFNTGDVGGGTTTSFTAPTKPGRYPYICEIHQYMTGVLVVT